MKNVKKYVALLVLVLVGIIMFDNKDVYAATKYTVTYNPGQGTGKNISMKGNKGETMVAPGQPGSYKYGDYRFLGWSLNKNATEASITQGSKFTLNRNMTLYAVWSDTTYIVYDRNGGQTGPKGVVPVKIGNAYVSKTAPTKSGYVFAGWILDTDKSKIYNPGDKINCKTTTGLTAKWKCQVKYVDSLNSSKNVSYVTNIGNVEVATGKPGSFGKTGYKFLGWSYDKNATKPSITTGTKFTVNQNVTLYAVWDNRVSLTYNSNGGSNGPTGVTNSVYGKAIQIKTKVPTRTGYDFVGWVLAGDESKVYKPGGTITLYKNGTLKAKWELKQYEVNYRPNGGEGNIVTRNYKYGKEVTIIRKPSAMKRTGYTFKGWTTSKNGSVKYNPGDIITVKNDMDLYAVWEINKYEIKMNANGGDLNGIKATITKEYGKDITISKKTPIREGYVFKGYSIEKNSKIIAYNRGEIISVNKDLTLYAVWEKQYIELDTNGSGQKTQYYEVINDGTAYKLPELRRTGYNFKGWSENKNAKEGYYYVTFKANDYYADKTSSGFEYKMNIGTSKHGKLYAIWQKNTFTVKYNLNGGTGEFATEKVKLGKNYEVPFGEPKKSGYSFVGWTTNKNDTNSYANSSRYFPGQTIKKVSKDYVLYAVWVKNVTCTTECTVFFDSKVNMQTENEHLRDDNEYPVKVEYVGKERAYQEYLKVAERYVESYESSESKLPLVVYSCIVYGEENTMEIINRYYEASECLNGSKIAKNETLKFLIKNNYGVDYTDYFIDYGIFEAKNIEEFKNIVWEVLNDEKFLYSITKAVVEDEVEDVKEQITEAVTKAVENTVGAPFKALIIANEVFAKYCAYQGVDNEVKLLLKLCSFDMSNGIKIVHCETNSLDITINYADWNGKTIKFNEPTYIWSNIPTNGEFFKAATFNGETWYTEVKEFNVYATGFEKK